jgi:hypothetical protein
MRGTCDVVGTPGTHLPIGGSVSSVLVPVGDTFVPDEGAEVVLPLESLSFELPLPVNPLLILVLAESVLSVPVGGVGSMLGSAEQLAPSKLSRNSECVALLIGSPILALTGRRTPSATAISRSGDTDRGCLPTGGPTISMPTVVRPVLRARSKCEKIQMQ